MIKVSVIVPVYNVEEYLEKCLESLVNQTLKDIEIIVVNDGSPDNSQKIIDRYKEKYHNIISIEDINHGQGYARNKGISLAKGKYIMFLDSDDTVELTILEKMYNIIEKQKVDVVISDINKIINNQKIYFKNYLEYNSKDNINLMLSHPGPVAKLYKKELFIKNNISFLEKVYYEDLAMTPILSIYVNKVCYIKEPLYNYLIRNNSTMTQTKFNPKLDDIFTVLKYLEQEFNIRSKNKYSDELEYLYIEHLLYSASLRYLNYNIYKDRINKIVNIIKRKYPNWNRNIYYQKKSNKFKLVCNLVYKKQFTLLKLLKKIVNK